MAVLALMAVCLAPVGMADGEPFTNISGEDNVIQTGKTANFDIVYDEPKLEKLDGDSYTIKYDAKLVDSKGNTVSSAVSPSTDDLENNVHASVKVTAPKTAGTYTLVVDFKVKVDSESRDPITEKMVIKVVDPVKLTVTLKGDMNSNIDPSGVGVYFYVDGEKYDDSYTTFTLNNNGTATVTYNLVEDLKKGSHTFWVESVDETNVMVDGLGEKHTFYVGEKSYTMWTALVVVILLIVIIAFVWVYRKPVKNYGKPKARR